MGVSAAAVFALLFAFAVASAAVLTDAILRAQREASDAAQDQDERALALRTGALEAVNRTWNAGTLELKVNNTGGLAFDTQRVDVLVDGVLRTDKVTARTVGGVSTRVWAPGEQLYLKLEGLPGGEPQRVWVVAATGASGVV